MSGEERRYFYVPGQVSVVDEVHGLAGGVEIGRYSGTSREALELAHPGLVVVTPAEYRSQANQAAKTVPVEIPASEFDELLHALPPQGWVRRPGSESFKLSEYYAVDVTTVVARIGDRYVRFRDVGTLTHDDVLRVVAESGVLARPAEEVASTPSP